MTDHTSKTERRFKLWPHRAATRWTVAASLVVVVALGGAVAFFLSDRARDLVAPRLAEALAPQGGAIRYGRVSGRWPEQIVVEDIHVADARGDWLTVDRITLEWKPWRLLRRKADVTRLAVERPVILRPPDEDDATLADRSDAGRTNTTFDLPVDVHLGSLTITDGEIVAPVEAGFAAQGALDLAKGRLRAQLQADRRGGADEHVRLDGTFDARDRLLHLDADVKTAADGLLAALSGIADLPAIELRATGEGPAENWRLTAEGSVGSYGRAALKGVLRWREDVALDIEGQLTGGPALAPVVRQLSAEGIALDAHWVRKDSIDDVTAALASAAADANFNIRLGAPTLLKARILTGSVSAQTKRPLAVSDGTTAGDFKASASLSGSILEPDAVVTFEAGDVATRGVKTRTLKGVLALDTREGAADSAYQISGEGVAEDVVEGGHTLIDSAPWKFEAIRQGARNELVSFTIDSNGLAVTASGILDGSTGEGKASASLEAADLAALTPFLGLDLSGSGKLALEAAHDGPAQAWQITATGATSDLVVDGTAATPLAGSDLAFAGRARYGDDGAIAIDDAAIEGDKLKLAAKGTLRPALDAAVSLNGDLALLGPIAGVAARGPLEAQIDAKGTLESPQFKFTAKSSRAQIEGRDLGTLAVALTPRGSRGFADSLARIDAKGPLGSAALQAPVIQQNGAWHVGPFGGSAYGAALSGEIETVAGGLNGVVKAVVPDLSTLMPLALGAGAQADGSATVTLAFHGADGIDVGITGRGIALAEPHVSASALEGSARLGAETALTLELQGGEIPGVQGAIYYDKLVLTAEGPRDRIDIALDGSGLTGAGGSLSVRGIVDAAGATQNVDLQSLNARLWDTSLALDAPTRLTITPTQTRLGATQLNIGPGGHIGLGFERSRNGLRGDVRLNDFPVPFLGRMMSVEWPQGVINGTFNIDSTKAKPEGSLDIALKDAYFSALTQTRMTPMHGKLTGTWDGRVFALDSSFSRDQGVPIVVKGRLPLERRGAGFAFNPSGAVAGNIDWQGRVGTLWTFLPLDLYRVDGDGTLRVTAAGTWGAPRIEGRLDIARGTFEGLSTGTRLSDLTLALEANTTSAHYTLTGRDNASGRLTSEGKVIFDTARHFPLEGTLDMTSLRLIGLDELTAIATGHAQLSGAVDAMTLKGDLTFNRVDALIPEKLPPSVPTLPVIYADQGDAPSTDEIKDDADHGIALDLKISVPARASLNGRGLTSQWRGDLAVTGTTGTPVVVGNASLERGTLAFAGRSFPLTKGSVKFDGGDKVDPMLDVAAVRTVNGIAITLAVTGRASAPQIEISSDPKVPQDEAMALLLLGKPAGSLTPLELLDVARAAATLSGNSVGGGGLDLVDRARRTLGLDVLTVDTSTGAGDDAKTITNSASVSAGRYVTDKVYVGVKQGVQTGSGAVELEIELTPNITATTEVGEQGGGTAGLNWKWDY